MATRKTPTASARAARGLSLHIGLNAVDPAAYAGWDGPLSACEFDAQDMAAIARSRSIRPTLLLTRQATRAAVLKALRAAAGRLAQGDLFLLSYSGHGGQLPDTSGDEPDKQDETWCLFDGQLIDDQGLFTLRRPDALSPERDERKAQNEAGVRPRRGFATPRSAVLAATLREGLAQGAWRRCPPCPGTSLGGGGRLALHPWASPSHGPA